MGHSTLSQISLQNLYQEVVVFSEVEIWHGVANV
jgi:hypothetical protein